MHARSSSCFMFTATSSSELGNWQVLGEIQFQVSKVFHILTRKHLLFVKFLECVTDLVYIQANSFALTRVTRFFHFFHFSKFCPLRNALIIVSSSILYFSHTPEGESISITLAVLLKLKSLVIVIHTTWCRWWCSAVRACSYVL